MNEMSVFIALTHHPPLLPAPRRWKVHKLFGQRELQQFNACSIMHAVPRGPLQPVQWCGFMHRLLDRKAELHGSFVVWR